MATIAKSRREDPPKIPMPANIVTSARPLEPPATLPPTYAKISPMKIAIADAKSYSL